MHSKIETHDFDWDPESVENRKLESQWKVVHRKCSLKKLEYYYSKTSIRITMYGITYTGSRRAYKSGYFAISRYILIQYRVKFVLTLHQHNNWNSPKFLFIPPNEIRYWKRGSSSSRQKASSRLNLVSWSHDQVRGVSLLNSFPWTRIGTAVCIRRSRVGDEFEPSHWLPHLSPWKKLVFLLHVELPRGDPFSVLMLVMSVCCCVEQVGTPFDYNIHNAIMRENTNEFEEDMVCKVSTP